MELSIGTVAKSTTSKGEHPKDIRKVCSNVPDDLIQQGNCVQVTGDASDKHGVVHSALRGNFTNLKGDVTNIIGNCSGVALDLDSIPDDVRKADGGCHLGTLIACYLHEQK